MDLMQMLREMMARNGGAVPPKADLGAISPPPQFSAQPPQPAPMPTSMPPAPPAYAAAPPPGEATVTPASDTSPSDLFGPDPLMPEQTMTANEQANLRATSGMPASGPDYKGMAGGVAKALATLQPPQQPEAPRVSAPGQYQGPSPQNVNPLLEMLLRPQPGGRNAGRDAFALSAALGR